MGTPMMTRRGPATCLPSQGWATGTGLERAGGLCSHQMRSCGIQDPGAPTGKAMSQTANQGHDAPPGRGQLRIYLGSAAGVGKTFAMLSEGLRRQERGHPRS